MQNCLLVSNCVTVGLAGCLQMLCPGMELEHYYLEEAQQNPELFNQSVAEADIAFVIPAVAELLTPEVAAQNTILTTPAFFFPGYHPDQCYVLHQGGILKSACGDYHSALCLSAYQAGLSLRQTRALYCATVFEQAGFLDTWAVQRDIFLESHKAAGLDMSQAFMGWAKRGPFMYSVNHPKVACLKDLAQAMLNAVDLPTQPVEYLPPDGLAGSAIFPVYEELAEQLGCRGSYLFKPPGRFKLIHLDEFLAECYAIYDTVDADRLEVAGFPQNRLNTIKEIVSK